MSLGEVKGHGEYVDKKTLQQVCECAREYTNGLRVRFNPESFSHGDGGLAGRIPADTIRVKGSQVIGDLHVYATYAHRDYLFELAEETPENFGLSMEFRGVPEGIDGKKYARCDEILAAAVVDLPAANATGLFSENKTTDNDTMKDEQVTALGVAIIAGLKPVLEALNPTPAATEYKEPDAAELKLAGVEEDDDDKTKKEKVIAYREEQKGLDRPATVRDVMQMYRQSGGRAASASASGKEAGENKDEDGKNLHPFEQHVRKYKETGMKEGRARARAARDFPNDYNDYVTRQNQPEPAKK